MCRRYIPLKKIMKGINLILNQIWWVYNLLELTEVLSFGGFHDDYVIWIISGT